MIRRRVEYYVLCDSARLKLRHQCDGNATAFNSDTQADCAESAKQDGWKQLSNRLWLCPWCVEKNEVQKEGGQA